MFLRLLRDLGSRPGAVPGGAAGEVAATLARHWLHRSRAAADVAAAHALEDDLPRLGEALVAGGVAGRVGVAVRTMRRVAEHLREKKKRVEIDVWVTGVSRELAPAQTDTLARHLLEVLDPDGSDTFRSPGGGPP